MEIEHVGVEGLAKVEKEVVSLQASSRVIKIIQDTHAQNARDKLCEGETITERQEMRFSLSVEILLDLC